MNCDFQSAEPGICRCTRCPNYVKADDCGGKIVAKCRAGERERPSGPRRAVTFTKALAKHAADRFKKVSAKEARRRLDICKACELFKQVDADSGYCTAAGCGCNVSSNVQKLINKAAWRSERCPHPDGDRWA